MNIKRQQKNDKRLKDTKDKIMCKKLEELSKLKIEDLYDIFEEEYSESPVDIYEILKKLNVEYVATDFSELSGVVNGIVLPDQADMVMGAVAAFSKEKYGRDAVRITVNAKDSYHRQKFTLAHELAHCMLHAESLKNGRLELRTSITSDDPREKEANILAGKILIPEKLLKLAYINLSIPFLPSLAEVFDVSENVMAARLEYLGMGYYII